MGRRLGSFRLLRRLGTGGMGAVYLAEHVVIGSRVAVKVLHPSLSTDSSILQRFHAEARAVNLIGHEHILKIYDLCHEDGLHYLIMEYLEGQPLSRYASEPLPAEKAIPLLAQVCDALAAAHDHGVVHRDLKPENIFLVERRGAPPFVKLLDFGVAKLLEDAAAITSAGMVVGTPAYMAPEQFESGPIDGRTDLYALGAVSYQISTGRLPFNSDKVAQLMRAHLVSVPTAPNLVRKDIPARWSEITLRALSKRPEDRYRDARAMKADLLASMDAPAPRPAAPAAQKPAVPRPVRPTFNVDVLEAKGNAGRRTTGMELSKDGVFLAGAGFAPRLFSTLHLTLHGAAGGVVRLEGEVVRYVSSAQALAWGMSEGVGVQFVHVTAAQKRALVALLKGVPIPPEPEPALDAANVGGPDPEVVLAPLRKRASKVGDPYAVLDVSIDADASTIRSRGRELRKGLQAVRTPRASAEQVAEAERLMERISRALQMLAEPPLRAEYDAAIGNYVGIAQSIAAGLTVTELERLRSRFLAERPKAASHATLETMCARSFEQQGELEQAAAAYERALRYDPLDLLVHQRLSSLRRQQRHEQRPSAPA
ncbi:MAG TPA: protein kinase [Myxococcaceae bacterium]